MRGDSMLQTMGLTLPALVSITGAGGKTTTMYRLAEQAVRDGLTVCVTTSTHIYRPEISVGELRSDMPVRMFDPTLPAFGENHCIRVCGEPDPKDADKLVAPEIGVLKQYFDLVLVEADGAKGFPVKLPRQGEPVIVPETDLVLGVVGMSSLGKPLGECCFRSEEMGEFFRDGSSGRMTCEDLVRLICSREALAKGTQGRRYQVVLAQTDGDCEAEAAKKIAGMVHERQESLRYGANNPGSKIRGNPETVPEHMYAVSWRKGIFRCLY